MCKSRSVTVAVQRNVGATVCGSCSVGTRGVKELWCVAVMGWGSCIVEESR